MNNEIESTLFKIKQEEYGDRYRDDIIELYKLYVEMTDRISQRRDRANQWFLAMNTALISAIVFTITKSDNLYPILIICVAGSIISYLWYRLIYSYQQMNSGRFKVIHAIEEKLPLKIYDAEWIALGRGKDPKKYKPFTHIEKNVPRVYMILYLVIGVWALWRVFC